MRRRIDWRPRETTPDPGEALRLQGIPAGVTVPRHISAILDDALGAYLDAAEPRAVVADVSHERFAAIYAGEGRNAPVGPIEPVVARAETLTLFAATVGARVTDRIQALFAEHELALAAMLDSVASAAADRLTHLLANQHAVSDPDATREGWQTLGYSPGYCGWHVTGQRALFEALAPEEIGITLNESCLMEPLKSVSGVLAAGPGEIHRFAPAYPFCADCRDKPCLGRIRSLSASATREAASGGAEEA